MEKEIEDLEEQSKMKNRLLIALIFIPLLVYIYIKGDYMFLLFTNVIVGVSLFEFYRMAKQSGREVALKTGVGLGMLATTMMYLFNNGMTDLKEFLIPGMVLFIVGVLGIKVLKKEVKGSPEYVGNTVLGLVYIPLLFLHIFGIKALENGGSWLLTIQILIWISDSAAYFVGMKFGRKLISKGLSVISPKKSFEGLFGSIIFTVLGIFLIKFLWFKEMNVELIHMFMIPLIISLVGTLGDLAESMFKREFGVKDSGDVLGEHGGILDRFDSMIFILPIIFYYFKFVIGSM